METSNRFEAAQAGDGRNRLLVEAITDYAIYMLDREGRVTSWNPGARRFKGYEANEIIGQHFSTFYTDAERSQNVPALALAEAERNGRFKRGATIDIIARCPLLGTKLTLPKRSTISAVGVRSGHLPADFEGRFLRKAPFTGADGCDRRRRPSRFRIRANPPWSLFLHGQNRRGQSRTRPIKS